MGLPKEIVNLIERFERNREAYKSGQYNEMQLRQEFLDPFFAALGWDMIASVFSRETVLKGSFDNCARDIEVIL